MPGLGNRSYRCAVMSSGRNASAYLHPICFQMYWAGQSLFLPLLLSLVTHLRTRPFTRILLLSFSLPFTSTSRSPLFSFSPYFESCFPSVFSEHIRFPVSSVFYTQRYSHRKSMKVKAEVFVSAKRQYLSIQKATQKKYECFNAVSSGMTCYFSACSEDSAHTQLTILLPSEILLLCRGIVRKRLFELKHTVDIFLKNVIPLSLHFEDDDTRIF